MDIKQLQTIDPPMYREPGSASQTQNFSPKILFRGSGEIKTQSLPIIVRPRETPFIWDQYYKTFLPTLITLRVLQ